MPRTLKAKKSEPVCRRQLLLGQSVQPFGMYLGFQKQVSPSGLATGEVESWELGPDLVKPMESNSN